MFTIYCITCLVNGKKYIGQTSRAIHDRWLEHTSSARCGLDTHLYRAIRKHGEENFQIEVLSIVDTPEHASETERYWISKLETTTFGYNSDEGGLGYYKPTPETIAKRIESIKRGYENGRTVWCARKDVIAQEVADLYNSGLSQRKIADKLKTSKRTIVARLKELNVQQRSGKDYKYTVSPETRQRMRDAKLVDPNTVNRMRNMTRDRVERGTR